MIQNTAQATPVAYPLSWVEPMRTEWLWRQWLPLGCITVLDGDPGLGKSTLIASLAARITTGRSMPPFVDATEVDPAAVVMLSAEDCPARTIAPRMKLAGADLENVILFEAVRRDDEEPVTLPCDVKHLETVVIDHKAKLVVIDPLTAYLDESVNTYKDHDVRRCLRQLHKLAEEQQFALLIVRHLNKAMGMSAKHRGGGSMGIIGAARAGWMVGTDPNDSDSQVLAVSKCNLSARPESLRYRIETVDDWSVIEWLGTCDVDADALVANPQSQKPDDLVALINKRGGRVTVRDLQRARQSRFPTSDAAETALEELRQAGLVRRVDQPTTARGGRATSVYELVTLDDTDTTS